MIDINAVCNEIRSVTDRTYECPKCGLMAEALRIYQRDEIWNIKGRHAEWYCPTCRAIVLIKV